MTSKLPHTPFSTSLSSSAREAEQRIQSIFSPPKRRPPALFLALVFAAALLCGNLVSCQQSELPPEPDRSVQDGDPSRLVRYDLEEGTRSLTLEDRWQLTIEDRPPRHDDAAMNTVLLCQDLETGAVNTLASLYYNRYGVEEEDIQLHPFDGILGGSGVIFSSLAEGDVPRLWLFRTGQEGPQPLAQCEGTLYTARTGDADLLLASYPFGYNGSRGGAALFWLDEAGVCRARPLRDAVEHLLGLDWTAVVSLSLEVREDTGTLAALWRTQGAPTQTMELSLSDLLAYARANAVRTEEVSLEDENGNRLLRLVLEERRLEDEQSWDVFEVERILVYRESELLQTLLPQDWAEPSFFGRLFDTEDHTDTPWGGPLVQDLNGDGMPDFALFGMESPARNLPYLYFLWRGEEEGFVPLATLCAPVEPDPETGLILERVNEGNGRETKNWYELKPDGTLTLVRTQNLYS